MDLKGRVALVTGASRGIGRAIALALAGRGASIVAADLLVDGVTALSDEINAAGGTAEWSAMNVTDQQSVQATVDRILERFGRLDILVNNAGIARDQILLRMKREEWDAVLLTNLTGAFVCTQAAIRPMMKQRNGRVISISSVVGQMGNAGQANYAASKAGIIGFTKALAREVASRSVTVNAVAPGFIDTDMTRALPEATRQEWAARVPLGRFGTAEEVASAVCFLASDEAAYITGQVLAVNGGMYT
ncbi:MAG: 3-oxoacyl-ACP reductase FabG [Vicinamibacterales bacterium]